MDNLVPIVKRGQRVLTTQQLAEAYKVDDKRIRDNYTNNKDRYVEGKHFIKIEGQELKQFKNAPETMGVVGCNASSVYLWTERGCLMHAKSLNTDIAWKVYDILVETYFRVKTQQIPASLPEALRLAADLAEKNLKLESENKAMLPKVEFFDTVADSKTAIDIGNAAKVLNLGIGRNRLFEVLRKKGVLMQNNVPYQKYIDLGYFRTIEQKYSKPDGSININIKTLVYQRGLEYIRNLLTLDKGSLIDEIV